MLPTTPGRDPAKCENDHDPRLGARLDPAAAWQHRLHPAKLQLGHLSRATTTRAYTALGPGPGPHSTGTTSQASTIAVERLPGCVPTALRVGAHVRVRGLTARHLHPGLHAIGVWFTIVVPFGFRRLAPPSSPRAHMCVVYGNGDAPKYPV